MLQTFVDLRGVVASVRRVRATLGQLPPDESMAAALPPPPVQPWVAHPHSQASHAGLPDEAPVAEPAAGTNGWAAHAELHEGGGRAAAAAQAGDLRLEGVSFAYPTRPGAPVLRDLTLTLPRGKVTAVVGRSGAGKSTVAALLERLYTPDAGAVSLGGQDIRGFSRTEWTGALAAVSQEPVLFPASIAYNIGGWVGAVRRCKAADLLPPAAGLGQALIDSSSACPPTHLPHTASRLHPHRLRAVDAVQPGGDRGGGARGKRARVHFSAA